MISSNENSYVDVTFPMATNSVSPLSNSTQNLVIKVKIEENSQLGLNGSTYKFEVNDLNSIKISKINSKIQAKLPDNRNFYIQLGYFDSQGDYILIDSDEDFNLAIKSQTSIFIVKVHENKTSLFPNIAKIIRPPLIKYISGLTVVILILKNTNLLYSNRH